MPIARRFSAVGFLFSLAMTLAAGAMLLAIQHVGFSLGEGPALEFGNIASVLIVCVVLGVWQGYRHSTALALQIVRFRQRWRKGRWVEIFAFAIGIAAFGAMLGVLISIPKWLPPADENASEVTLTYVGMSVLAGFFGGFLFQFTPIPRRPRY